MSRILLISNPCSLSLHNCQLVIKEESEVKDRIPVEDLDIVIIESQAVTITEALVAHLADTSVPLVCCDASHCPVSISFPLKGHCFQGEIIRKQLSLEKPFKDELWREIVRKKIQSEIGFISSINLDAEPLEKYLSDISDDCGIDKVVAMEAAAAKYHFDQLFGKRFVRNRYGFTPNDFLNYGYTVLRSVVIRELIGCGLFLGEGLYHRNRSNEFPLADDVIEPYRVYVDEITHGMFCEGVRKFDSDARKRLLGLLFTDVKIKGQKHKLSDAVRLTASSVMKVLTGEKEAESVLYPE